MSNIAPKTDSRYSVNIEILKAFGAEIEKLPVKERVSYDVKEAVNFLRPFLDLALEKNYTKDEIFGLMEKVGWNISRNKFKYLWGLYLLEKKNSGKKKKNSKKSLKEIKTENLNKNASSNEAKLSYDLSIDENENKNATQAEDLEAQELKIETEKNPEQNNKNGIYGLIKSAWQGNSAHFEVKPDTEDL